MDIQAQLAGSSQTVSWRRVQQSLQIEPVRAPDEAAADVRKPEPESDQAGDEQPSLNTRILTAFLEKFLNLRLEDVERLDPQSWQARPLRQSGSLSDDITLRFERIEERFEAQSVRLDVSATVRWPDGTRSESRLSLRMDRVEYQRRIDRLEIGERKDPLIINLDGQGAALDAQRVDFDLRGDGQLRAIPTPAPGNALLARDVDGNGLIDDGRELPGALSGDAWATLRALDDNADGALSATDPAFDQLRLLRFAPDGEQRLTTLASEGIRALALEAINTPFTLTATDGERLGEIRSSGFYLREDGQLGPAQRVDFFL